MSTHTARTRTRTCPLGSPRDPPDWLAEPEARAHPLPASYHLDLPPPPGVVVQC